MIQPEGAGKLSDPEQGALLTIAIVAGESSGDQLGSRLMQQLSELAPGPVRFIGVGGPLMEGQGLKSFFPMADIAVNGLIPVIARLPKLLARIRETAKSIAKARPDIVVHIDAQDFNKRVATKLKELIPETPLIGYVSPTVWAWRPGRAKKIKKLFDLLLAVLPFEPEVHRKLGGPSTIYVGHPLMERSADWIRSAEDNKRLETKPWQLLILPGSRESEVRRLLPIFRETVAALAKTGEVMNIVIPAVPHLVDLIGHMTSDWPMQPEIVLGENAKWQAFRTARAALAASGTVTLELALAKVPTVVAYRVGRIEGKIARRLISVAYASLPNIILDRPLLPEYIERNWTGADLAPVLLGLMTEGEAREVQLSGFYELKEVMSLPEVTNGHSSAAALVIEHIKKQGAPILRP